MKKFLYRLWSKFLTMIGDVKIFRFPMFVVYDPSTFRVSGEATQALMEIVEPGDVLIRGFSCYLDSCLVPSKDGWSHGAIYVGRGRVIHAVAEGVSETNLVEFSRCDRIAVLRPMKGQRRAIKKAKEFLREQTPYDFGFERGSSALYCFELCAEAYDFLDVDTIRKSRFFGLLKRDVYLAESFIQSPDFTMVYKFNP